MLILGVGEAGGSFCMIYITRRELHLDDVIKQMFQTGLHSLIQTNLLTNLFQTWYDDRHSWTWHLDTNVNDISHKVIGLWDCLGMCSHSDVNWYKIVKTFAVVNYVTIVMEITAKKSRKYGEYEPFEHLLCLLFLLQGDNGGTEY